MPLASKPLHPCGMGATAPAWLLALRRKLFIFNVLIDVAGSRGWHLGYPAALDGLGIRVEDPFQGAPWCNGDPPHCDPAADKTTGDGLLNALSRAAVATYQLPDLTGYSRRLSTAEPWQGPAGCAHVGRPESSNLT